MTADADHDRSRSRVVLLGSPTSSRLQEFLHAARAMGLDATAGIIGSCPLSNERLLQLNQCDLTGNVDRILRNVEGTPTTAVIGVDDETVELASAAAKALRLPHNTPASIAAAHDKYLFRSVLRDAGIRSPRFSLVPLRGDYAAVAGKLQYPCVIKPRNMSGSRGVIRVDDSRQFIAAAIRVESIVAGSDQAGAHDSLLVESYVPGEEIALEGLLDRGRLITLALFDKPEPLCGPCFEETVYVTPSRHAPRTQQQVRSTIERSARALGLRSGAIHAEARINRAGIWPLEIAARSIGGRCGTALRFGNGEALETLILRQALGLPFEHLQRERPASGVMMMPTPRAGYLAGIDGIAAAEAVPGIGKIVIDAHAGELLQTLPDDSRCPGYLFAHGENPRAVHAALTTAFGRLTWHIRPVGTAPVNCAVSAA